MANPRITPAPSTRRQPASIVARSIRAAAELSGLSQYAHLWTGEESLAQAKTRIDLANRVTALCKKNGMPKLADVLIRARASLAVANATIRELKASETRPAAMSTIRNSLSRGTRKQPSVGEIYRRLNQPQDQSVLH